MKPPRLIAALLSIALLACTANAFPTDPVTLDKPALVSFHKSDDTAMSGRVKTYDKDHFDLLGAGGKSTSVAWSDLDAHNMFLVRAALLAPKDADGFVDLGHDLLASTDGKSWAEKAFARAIRIDPSAKAKVEAARLVAASQPSSSDSGTAQDPNGSGAMTTQAGMGPRVIGQSRQENWGVLPDADQARLTDQLKNFADEAGQKLGKSLHLQETKFFLFYSDLNPTEANNWAGLLDRMYARLAELFAVPKGQNVWRGKCLIFVFSDANDYRRFEQQVQKTDPGQSAGMTHCYGDGIVHIAFYRQTDELNFAHVLVHESVHGFLHRYKSPEYIPSWANEGLAETIGAELVPNPRRSSFIPGLAKGGIKAHGGDLNGFFAAEHIDAWGYSVAETLTVFMIRQSKKNYVDFINGIKDGLSWRDSLEKKYKVALPRLVAAYGQSMGEAAHAQ